MRLIVFVLGIIFLSGCVTTGVVQKEHYYKPLNKLQEDFYAVQSVFNSAKYSDTIDLGLKFIEKHPRDVLTVAVRYYIASSYQEIGDFAKSKEYFNSVLKTNNDDDWGKLARVGLEEIKDMK